MTERAPTSSPTLWNEVADAGERAMAELRGSPGYQRATPAARMAAESRYVSMAMIKMLVEELERHHSEPALRYVGVWRADRAYRKGDFATHSGSLWHCDGETNLKPGEGQGWQLAVRRGQDGKDAR